MIFEDKFDALYSFQKEGVSWLANRMSALLADDMGTGKTAQTLVASQHIGADNILIICPATVKYNWLKEAIKWGYNAKDILVIDNKTLPRAKDHKGVFIINYDLIHRALYARVLAKKKYDVLICDECHNIKDRDAKRTKAVFNSGGYCDLSTYRWMLSGTPVLNRPLELYGMLKKLCPESLGQFTNYIQYTKRFCNGRQGKWGWDASGATNVDELAGRLDGFMLRRSRDELKDLPDRVLRTVYTPITPEIEKYLFAERSGNESARRLLGIAKVKTAADYIEQILQEEDKVVVFAYHTDVIEGLREELWTYEPAVIQGSVAAKKRQAEIDRFRNDKKCQVFIGQIDAAGEGIDGLQGACRYGIFVELSYVPGKNLQAIGRLHRNGQAHKVLIDFFLVEGSNDERVFSINLGKANTVKTLMKDDATGFEVEGDNKIIEPELIEPELIEPELIEPELIEQKKETVMSTNNENNAAEVTIRITANNGFTPQDMLGLTAACQTYGTIAMITLVYPPKYINQIPDKPVVTDEPVVPVIEDDGMIAYDPIPVQTPAQKKKTRTKKQTAPAAAEGSAPKYVDYTAFVQQVANTISAKASAQNPTLVNELFSEISERFQKMFPQYEQVFDVTKVEEQQQVIDMLDDFLIEKGL